MIRALFSLAVLLFVVSCATPYGPIGSRGGVDALQLDDTTYKITARGNGFTTSDRVQDFVLLKASEIAKSRGYHGFIIKRSIDETTATPVIIPGYAMTNSYGSVSGFGNSAFGSINSTTTYIPPTETTIFKPGVAVIVTLVNAGGMDAGIIYASLAPKYGMQPPMTSVASNESDAAAPPPTPPAPTVTPTSTTNDAAKSWLQKAIEAGDKADWPEMVRTANVAISLDPNYTDAYIERSRAYLNLGFWDKAKPDIDTALARVPSNVVALNNRGVLHRNQGQRDLAISDYDQACSAGYQIACDNYKALVGYLPAEKPQKLVDQSFVQFNAGNWPGVISLATQAISLNPNMTAAYVNRAGANVNLGNLSAGIADADHAISLDPDNGMAYENKAVALEKLGQKEDAMLAYASACHLGVAGGCGKSGL